MINKTFRNKLFIIAFISALVFSQGAQARSFTTQEANCIRRVVWGEAGVAPKVNRDAVFHVILNRSKSWGKDKKPKPICWLVNQPHQFYQKTPPANFTVDFDSTDPTGGAIAFQGRDQPVWFGNRRYIKLGPQVFYGR